LAALRGAHRAVVGLRSPFPGRFELGGRRNQRLAQTDTDQTFINSFDEAHADLIAAAAAETALHEHERRIETAYGRFCEALRAYSDTLPDELLADLNDLTRDFYDRVNAHDTADDTLARLLLPRQGGERITIAFDREPEELHDALQVLSEGHLRCLGLAILLAKNVKIGLPVIVFDDVVNAIDDEHRTAIREMIVGDARLRAKQLLITCHSPEFLRMFQNVLGEGASVMYAFGHHQGDYQPRITDATDRNYLGRARASMDDGDLGQCMAFCRQALEYLTHRTWKRLKSKEESLASFKVELSGPGEHPDLLPLSVALAKAMETGLTKKMLKPEEWAARLDGFNAILKVDQHTALWRYLNRGTHHQDDKPDFEAPLVRQILDGLTAIRSTYPA
jgi:hypothetical protein